MIHKGLKPFQCTICEQRFREKSNYNFHMKKHLLKLNKKIKNEKEDNVKNNYEKKFTYYPVIVCRDVFRVRADRCLQRQL